MTSVQAAHPQSLIPVNEVVDLRPLLHRSFFHEAHEGVGTILCFGPHCAPLPSGKPVGKGKQLQPVGHHFLVHHVPFAHTGYRGAEGGGGQW